MKLEMLPYGNAQGTGSNITCQHGPTECHFNMVEACAIKHEATPDAYMAFVFCAEAVDTVKTPAAVIESCSSTPAMAKSISTCYGKGAGAEGIALENTAAAKTAPLNHQYTPWVEINGEHSTLAEDNLAKALCQAYKGPNAPAACSKYVDKRCSRSKALPKEDTSIISV